MKGKLCGLLLALFIMLGLSLSINLNDTSAKQYIIDSFLAHGISNGLNSGYISAPSFTFISDFDTSTVDARNTSYLLTKYNSSSNKCVYDNSYRNPGYEFSSDGRTISYSGDFYPIFSTYDSNITLPTDDLLCRTSYPYGYHSDLFDLNIPEYDTSSTPFDKSISVSSMTPYNYMFNVLYFNGSRIVDGVEYSSNFDLSEMLNPLHVDDSTPNVIYYSDKLSSVSFPINFDSSLEGIDSGTNIVISGSLNFNSSLSDEDYSHIRIGSRFNYNGSNRDLSCSTSVESFSLTSTKLSFICNIVAPVTVNAGHYAFNFRIYTDSILSRPLTSNNQSITFNDFSIILNDDSTSGGYGGFGQTGSFPNVAPGIPDTDPEQADWFSSITNMFGFDFINPFAPLFEMFSNNNSCANIPTIASMIHAENSQVCPWFDSTTRNIVTPVLGIASMMLVFGFAVRWLGSSSGNMFTDSANEEVSNQGGRWGHYKKGGN